MLDLMSLNPTTISRDLKGKLVMLYGMPKVGKTSLSAQFPKNLILGFEHGWNALANTYAVDIASWAEFKRYLKQLEKPEAKDKFNTITIDTIGIAWTLCEAYICQQNGVQKISDIPWGQGYSACTKEFENTLRKIIQAGYGLVIIAHDEIRKEQGPNDTEILCHSPNIPKRAYGIVNQLVDIIGYIDCEYDEQGIGHRYIYTRKTPTIMAGSRFPYLKQKIEFGYQQLVDAIGDAIDKAAELDNAKVVDHAEVIEKEVLDYNKIKARAEELFTQLVINQTPDIQLQNHQRIMKKCEILFGHPIDKLSSITEDQVEIFNLVVEEMEEMTKNG